MLGLDEILKLMSWHNSLNQQKEGIALARKTENIKGFFQPIGLEWSKDVWENCAIVISERSDEELLPYFADMILWLEDMNWPGAEIIKQRLIHFADVQYLASVVSKAAIALFAVEEYVWVANLSEVLEAPNIVGMVNPHVLTILHSAETMDSAN